MTANLRQTSVRAQVTIRYTVDGESGQARTFVWGIFRAKHREALGKHWSTPTHSVVWTPGRRIFQKGMLVRRDLAHMAATHLEFGDGWE